MNKTIRIIGYNQPIFEKGKIINTTSKSKNWSKKLSPFFLGPVKLYDQYVAENMENAWQFSKCYIIHCDQQQKPTEEYFKWAQEGWKQKKQTDTQWEKELNLCSHGGIKKN